MEEERKSRVAVGVFYDPAKLQLALDALNETVPTDTRIMVSARPSVIGNAFPDKPVIEDDDIAVCVLREADLFNNDYSVSFDQWLDHKSADRLTKHIEKEGCALFTFFSGATEESSIYRILIELACDRVELHDLPPCSPREG